MLAVIKIRKLDDSRKWEEIAGFVQQFSSREEAEQKASQIAKQDDVLLVRLSEFGSQHGLIISVGLVTKKDDHAAFSEEPQ